MRFATSLLCLFSVVVELNAAEKRGPEILVVADAKTSEPAARLPTPDQPVYYYLIGQKEKAIGSTYAGEKVPITAEIETQVVRALASQNYVRTQVGGEKPTLFLMVVWGTASAAVDDIPGDGGTVIFNRREMSQLLGAGKAIRKHEVNAIENEQIHEAMQEDRVYVMIGAFDAEAMAKKQKILVWRTSMSMETLHHSFPDSLETMLTSAAPYLGHDTDKGYAVDDSARKRGKVDIGQLKVIHVDAPATAVSRRTFGADRLRASVER